MMVEKRKYFEVGGLEEQGLRVAFNDTDFCLKLRQKGYQNILNPRAILRHHESKSRGYEDTPEKIARFKAEADYMKNKWENELMNDDCYNKNLTLKSQDFALQSIEELCQRYNKVSTSNKENA
jgi:GT2 family glycosyltransferase